jgi:membrane protease YdiL (CAAX protease family)
MLGCVAIEMLLSDPNKSQTWDIPIHMKILLGAIIVPIAETIIFQFIPKLILDFVRIKNYYVALVIMSVFFSALHGIHARQDNILLSIVFTLGSGVLVNYYLQAQKREGTRQAVIKTMILHGTFNLTLTILTYILY